MVREWRETTVMLGISARREESQGEQNARDLLKHLQCQFIVSVLYACEHWSHWRLKLD